jgi:hypothetical protein
VLAGTLGVRALAGSDRQEDVSLGENADARMVGVHNDRGANLAGSHHPRRLPQRVGRTDGENPHGHSIFDFHGAPPPRAVSGIGGSL